MGTATAYVEGDFYGTSGAFRLRHAYGTAGGWRFGQAWGIASMGLFYYFPTVDFSGPAGLGGVPRTPQLRYTFKFGKHSLAVGVEGTSKSVAVSVAPESAAVLDSTLGVASTNPAPLPTLSGAFVAAVGPGKIGLGLALDSYRVVSPDGVIDAAAMTNVINIGGNFPFGRHAVRFHIVSGGPSNSYSGLSPRAVVSTTAATAADVTTDNSEVEFITDRSRFGLSGSFQFGISETRNRRLLLAFGTRTDTFPEEVFDESGAADDKTVTTTDVYLTYLSSPIQRVTFGAEFSTRTVAVPAYYTDAAGTAAYTDENGESVDGEFATSRLAFMVQTNF